jgi:hypothetical protein
MDLDHSRHLSSITDIVRRTESLTRQLILATELFYAGIAPLRSKEPSVSPKQTAAADPPVGRVAIRSTGRDPPPGATSNPTRDREPIRRER